VNHTIVVYTAPGCPDCAAVKRWLEQHGCAYTEKDVSRPGVADEAKERYGVRIAPITVIDDRYFYGTFDQQLGQLAAALDITD
jgi:glutaredoxin 3